MTTAHLDRHRAAVGKRRKAMERIIREAVHLHGKCTTAAEKEAVLDAMVEAIHEVDG